MSLWVAYLLLFDLSFSILCLFQKYGSNVNVAVVGKLKYLQEYSTL